MELIKLVLTHIEDKKNIYSAIMVNNRNGVMMDIIIDVVNKDIRKRVLDLGSTKSSVPADIIIKFYLGAIINVGIDWITENKYTKEEVIGYLDKLLPDNMEILIKPI